MSDSQSDKSDVSGESGSETEKSQISEDSNESQSEKELGEGDEDDENKEIQNDDENDEDPENKQQENSNQDEEHQNIDRMEAYLKLEAEIIKHCQQNKTLWVDKEFPASKKSLFCNPSKPPEWARDVKVIKWQRPHDNNKDAKFKIDNDWEIKQGAFGESWFISALMIVQTRDIFVEKLIVDSDHFDMGFVTFQFFKNGEWQMVTVDTQLPFDPDSKQVCIGQSSNPNEYWISLMEKAYAKLYGCYENIINYPFIDGLVDVTGGIAENWTLTLPEVQAKIENNQLWQMIMNYYNNKFFMGCVNQIKGKKVKNADTGPHGILENSYYGIIDVREFPKENLKLIRIRNPWGTEGGWNGPFSDDSEEWDKHRNLRTELNLVFKQKKTDGTWWMSFQDWCVHFNTCYVVKVFNENWTNFSIESKWQGKTAGSICPPKVQYESSEPFQKYIKLDTDERWFNNPQFRLKVEKETKLYISLMQEDAKLSKVDYIKTNIMVVSHNNRNSRIWERPDPEDIIIEGNVKKDGSQGPLSEIVQLVTLRKFEGKPYGYYMIIPNSVTDNKKDENRRFWLRLFASEPIEIIEMPEPIEVPVDGQWVVSNAGGKRRINKKDNPQWCRNPQYFLNISKPTNIKIILKKTGNLKKNKGIKIGLTICRQIKTEMKEQDPKDRILIAHSGFEILNQIAEQNSTKNKNIGITKLIQQTADQLQPPLMEEIERKLQIDNNEIFYESQYNNDEVCALYFKWNPTEGPFIIIPSLDMYDKTSNFKLSLFSDNPVELRKLDEEKNAVLIGRWESDISDGGCHLHFDPYEKDSANQTWTSNPKFYLQFKQMDNPIKVKITLSIAEKNWKSKTKDAVGGMIGIYFLKKSEKKMGLEHLVRDPQFIPITSISEEYILKDINPDGYFIMPTTYNSKIIGDFILSVTATEEFTLVKT